MWNSLSFYFQANPASFTPPWNDTFNGIKLVATDPPCGCGFVLNADEVSDTSKSQTYWLSVDWRIWRLRHLMTEASDDWSIWWFKNLMVEASDDWFQEYWSLTILNRWRGKLLWWREGTVLLCQRWCQNQQRLFCVLFNLDNLDNIHWLQVIKAQEAGAVGVIVADRVGFYLCLELVQTQTNHSECQNQLTSWHLKFLGGYQWKKSPYIIPV